MLSFIFTIEANMKLEKDGEEDKVDATSFKQIVGSFRYLCNRRLDICFLVGLVSNQFYGAL